MEFLEPVECLQLKKVPTRSLAAATTKTPSSVGCRGRRFEPPMATAGRILKATKYKNALVRTLGLGAR